MSRLSDTWHSIRSGFDINKMKRDPLGSIAKLGAIYGLGTSLYGAVAPESAATTAKWMRSGFGLYDDPATGTYSGGKSSRGGAGYSGTKYTPNPTVSSSRAGSFLERGVKSVGGFFASPMEFGRDLNDWYSGKKSWNDVRETNFGWMKNPNGIQNKVQEYLLGGASPVGGGGGGRGQSSAGRKVTHRDFTANTGQSLAANISQARGTSAYKAGGPSQALIAGSLTPETLAMLRYGSGQVQGAQARNITLSSGSKIQTKLRSAIG